MADTPSLFPELSLLSLPGRFVNPRCVIRELDGTRVAFVSSQGLTHKGDVLHFDSPSLREFGRRYAHAFLMLDADWKN